MATETKNCMTQTIDAMANSFQAGFEASRKGQKAMFDAFSGMTNINFGFENFFPGKDQFNRDFVPMMEKHANAVVDCFDSATKTNIDAFRTVTENSFNQETPDVYGQARNFFDTTMTTARENLEQFSNTGKTVWTEWSNFASNVQSTPVPASKGNGKAGK